MLLNIFCGWRLNFIKIINLIRIKKLLIKTWLIFKYNKIKRRIIILINRTGKKRFEKKM